jgi:hypothetical protein
MPSCKPPRPQLRLRAVLIGVYRVAGQQPRLVVGRRVKGGIEVIDRIDISEDVAVSLEAILGQVGGGQR